MLKLGERALTLARVFDAREGYGLTDDHLAERSYGPTTSGPLSDGGIDREELCQAVRTYCGMMGWDLETGVPLAAKLHELGLAGPPSTCPSRSSCLWAWGSGGGSPELIA